MPARTMKESLGRLVAEQKETEAPRNEEHQN